MINWKVVVGSGVAAAVLSLLTGIISGVSFGALLPRALMWGIIFCGLGAGVSLLISRYLPELVSRSTSEAKAETRPNVDIVLPDENPHADRESNDRQSSDDLDAETLEPADGGDEYSGDFDRFPASGNTLVEEVEELERPRGASRQPGAGSGSSDEDVETAEELPDLEGETEDFTVTGERDSFRSDNIPDIVKMPGRGTTVDVLGHKADSEEIAQAIRTALKKDQKG